jgi:hypothetical protein
MRFQQSLEKGASGGTVHFSAMAKRNWNPRERGGAISAVRPSMACGSEPFRIKPKSNPIKANQTKSNQIKVNQGILFFAGASHPAAVPAEAPARKVGHF